MSQTIEPGRHTEIHRRIAAALAELVPDDPLLPPHPYLRRHLAEHAAHGRVLDDTHVPPALLPWESSLSVRQLLADDDDAGSAGGSWLRAWARLEPFARHVDPLSRATSLRLAHAAETFTDEGQDPPPEAFAQAPVTPVWSEGRGPDNVWLVTPSRVTSLCTVAGTKGSNGPLVVAGDDEGRLHTVRRDGSTLHAPLQVHGGAVTHLLALPGGQLVATGSTDGSVAIVDILKGRKVLEAVPRRPHTWVSSLALYHPEDHTAVLLAAFSDGYLAVLNPAVFHPIDIAVPQLPADAPLLCAVTSPAGKHLLLFTDHDTVHAFDGHTTEELARLDGRVRALLALPTPGHYAAADERGHVSVHRTDRPEEAGTQRRHGQNTAVTALMVAHVSGRPSLLSASGDGSVRLWALPDLEAVGEPLPVHSGTVTAISPVDSSQPRLVTAGADCTVRSWPLNTQTFRHAPRVRDRITASASCPSVPHVLASAQAQEIRVLDIRTKERITVLTGHTATALAWPRISGKLHLAAALEDNRIVLIDYRRSPGQLYLPPVQQLAGHYLPALALASLPGAHTNTDLLASASADGRVCVWDLGTAQLLAAFPDHRFSVRCLAAARSSNGALLVSGGSDGKVRLWNMESLEQQGPTITCQQYLVTDVAVTPDHDQRLLVASTGQDGTLKVWIACSGEQVGEFSPGDGELSAVAALLLPSGRSLLAVAGKTSIHVWDPSANRRLLQIVTGESITGLETVADWEGGSTLLHATGETSTTLIRLHHDRI
ncbi:WD40 repeat domain-containing protein [Streptomyces erythrochromogenes]|uniref:WD40 repeat domain-containing protein n=1 Tax=Streptomyces erythrochromogenes TaxID=285574 RepID=UPI0036B2FD9A